MAADLHIHILETATEDDVVLFQCNTFGSKRFNLHRYKEANARKDLYILIFDQPNIWIGEVSWLKSALSDNKAEYVPKPVESIYELIGEDFPILTDDLIAKIIRSLNLENKTQYELNSNELELLLFLDTHKGKKCFTISW